MSRCKICDYSPGLPSHFHESLVVPHNRKKPHLFKDVTSNDPFDFICGNCIASVNEVLVEYEEEMEDLIDNFENEEQSS